MLFVQTNNEKLHPFCYAPLYRQAAMQIYRVLSVLKTRYSSEAVVWWKDSSKAVLLLCYLQPHILHLSFNLQAIKLQTGYICIMACLQVGITK